MQRILGEPTNLASGFRPKSHRKSLTSARQPYHCSRPSHRPGGHIITARPASHSYGKAELPLGRTRSIQVFRLGDRVAVCFILAPGGYDEPAILRSWTPSVCLWSADGGHSRGSCEPSWSLIVTAMLRAV